MRIAYFGTYERRYPRNAQVISCLRRSGVDVVEEHVEVWGERRTNWSAGLLTGFRVAAAEVRLAARRAAGAELLLVGYPGHFDLPAARRVAQGRPVVFNPLLSLADTLVSDRGRFRPGSIAARALEAVDRRALGAADLVVADTQAHARFLSDLAGHERFAVCLVGAEERVFQAGWRPPPRFTALFIGKLIPLQGIETILGAARLAPEVAFRVVGTGQLDRLLRNRPANVEHVPWIEYDSLPQALHGAGCALGIFGTSGKAGRVIPNKAFQALACGTPLVTASTPAARELLVDGESALLVPPGEPIALAEAVRRLAGDPKLAAGIAASGHAAYEAQASEQVLGARWRGLLEDLIA